MSNSISTLEFEYASGIAPGGAERRDAEALADCRGKRIGILIVTYNAVTTLAQVLRRITPEVWKNVEEVVVLDDASADATYELAVGLKTLADMDKLHVIKNKRNLGMGEIKRPDITISSERVRHRRSAPRRWSVCARSAIARISFAGEGRSRRRLRLSHDEEVWRAA